MRVDQIMRVSLVIDLIRLGHVRPCDLLRMIALRHIFLLLPVFSTNFDGQVLEIFQFFKANQTAALPFGPLPTDYLPFIIGSGTASPEGQLTATWGSTVGLVRTGAISLPDGQKLVHHFEVTFNTTGVPVEEQQEPRNGAFVFGPTSPEGISFLWLLTDRRVYALIDVGLPAFDYAATWIVPLADKLPGESLQYSVIIGSKTPSVTYYINNKLKMRLCGPFGIDPVFLVRYEDDPVLLKAEASPDRVFMPDFSEPNFPKSFINYFYLFNYEVERPVCLDALYDNCHDTIAYAASTRCRFSQEPPVEYLSATMRAFIKSVQIYTIGETDRCLRDDSTNSVFIPWLHRPANKMDQADNYIEE